MTLETTTRHALSLTTELAEALSAQDIPMCLELLEQRGAAMEAFEAAHRSADAAALRSCADLVTELASADTDLQAGSRDALASLAQLRHSTAGQGGGNGQYDMIPAQACVDRRA